MFAIEFEDGGREEKSIFCEAQRGENFLKFDLRKANLLLLLGFLIEQLTPILHSPGRGNLC